MIEYNDTVEEVLEDKEKYTDWLLKVIQSEFFFIGNISYVFLDDESMLELNKKYLKHDYYTDIITFNYTSERELSGDIYISWERVKENAMTYKVSYQEELRRVMVHGILHLMGYNDKSAKEKKEMKHMEDDKIKMFHVEQ